MNAPDLTLASDDLLSLTPDQPTWFRQAFDIPRSEHYADCDGTPIHYFLWGNPDNPGVVMTHGFMAHARCWAFIAPLLADNFCVAAFDLSGMGDSGWRENYSVGARAAEAAAVARHAGFLNQPRKPALVCHSYGGSVGLEAATLFPEMWSSLIICDMSLLAPDEPSRFEEHRERRAERGARPHRVYADFETVRTRFRLAPEQPCQNQYLMEYMARHSVKAVDGGFIWKFDPSILGADDERDPDWWSTLAPRFAHLTIPRAIVYGEHSEMMSDQAIAYLKQESDGQIPIVKIPDAYHHIMLDQPLALVTTLDTILQAGH